MKEQISYAADRIRAFLGPRWREIHAAGYAGTHVPDIYSTNCCRESSVVGLIVLEALGMNGWRIESGEIPVDKEDLWHLPTDITDVHGFGVPDESLEAIAHTWLVNDDADLILDLTADQFGALLVRTGDEALVTTASHMRHTYVPYNDDVEDQWTDDPNLVGRPLGWTKNHEFGELLADLSDDLEVEADLHQVRSVPPADIHECITEIRSCSFDHGIPSDPVSALQKIHLFKKLDDAQWARPHPQARQRATEALRDIVASEITQNAPWAPATPGADPVTDRDYVMKCAETWLLREDELTRRRNQTSTMAP